MLNRFQPGCGLFRDILFVGLFFLISFSSVYANNALWIAESEGVLKIATADGAILFEINDPDGVDVVTISADDQNVWTYGKQRLKAYTPNGQLLLNRVTPEMSRQGNPVDLVADHQGVRLALGRTLLLFDRQGQFKKSIQLRRSILSMTLDTHRSWVWVSVSGRVFIFDQDGNDVNQFWTYFPFIAQLDYDAFLDETWVTAGPFLLRLHAANLNVEYVSRFSVGFYFTDHLSADGAGGAWGAARDRLSHIAQYRHLDFSFKPFEFYRHKKQLKDLAVDLGDQSVWVANRNTLKQFDIAGRQQKELTPDLGDGVIRRIKRLSIAEAGVKPPTVKIDSPESDAVINNNRPMIKLSYRGDNTIDTDSIAFTVNEAVFAVNCDADQIQARCTPNTALPEGRLRLTASVADDNHQVSEAAEVAFTVDTVLPVIDLTHPQDGLITNNNQLLVQGRVSEALDALTLLFNGDARRLAMSQLGFSETLSLLEGNNTLMLTASDLAGNQGSVSVGVTLDTHMPMTPDIQFITISEPVNGQVTVIGQMNSVEAHSQITVINRTTNEQVIVTADEQGRFVATIAGSVNDSIEVLSTDAAGNRSERAHMQVMDLPADPIDVAPTLVSTGVTPFSESIAFLYSGDQPIQTGVAAGTIEFARAAVIRGQVLNKQNQALPGVMVTIKDHPELGQTLSRADGRFDLAVNGGGLLTINYAKDGFLAVQRQVQTPWKNYAFAEDVVMIALDRRVTTINANSPIIQVAQGRAQTDSDGTRQATLLFPAGTTATMMLPSGEAQALTRLNVRATEYTVGENGPETMPAMLPPTSGYTYAVELSVDEAIAANATRVQFNQAVALYVDNFLNFPVGEVVPVGFYDREKSAWIPSDNGRIISILSIENHQASVDVLGEGNPATQTELDKLGITQAELQQLANLYPVGKSVWRSPIPHFSSWDCNWPSGAPKGAGGPGGGAGSQPKSGAGKGGSGSDSDTKDTNECDGCIIQAQGQLLREDVPISGTPFSLHYRSDRVPAHKAKNAITIPLSGESPLHESLNAIAVEVRVAGRRLEEIFPPEAGQQSVFEWDGEDIFGRALFGTVSAEVIISYVYPCVSMSARDASGQAFAQPAFGATPIGTRSNCEGFKYSRAWTLLLESPLTPSSSDVGVGWSISPLHNYDFTASKIYLGDGTISFASRIRDALNVVAGSGATGFEGDGGPAKQAKFNEIGGIVFDDAGNLYIADQLNQRIRRIDRQGMISTYAGNGTPGYSGDGGLAVDASLLSPTHLAIGSNSSLFVVELNRVRKIYANGIITTVAGNGSPGFSGDGGLAINANLNRPTGIAVAPDGGFYIADSGNARVRYVNPAGIIRTIAGNGEPCFQTDSCGDGGAADKARLIRPTGLALDSHGNLYIGDTGRHEVLQVSVDGGISKVAGTRAPGNAGDGGPAVVAQLWSPEHLAMTANDDLLIANKDNIRTILGDGTITSIVGTGEVALGLLRKDGTPALAANISGTKGLAMHPQRILFFSTADYKAVNSNTVSQMSRLLTPAASSEMLIASRDGRVLYYFNNFGLHLRTRNALTNALQYEFGYGANGKLVTIMDGDGDITEIERDASGRAQAIISADGQRTNLRIDENGHLIQVINPADERYAMSYTPGGLLTAFSDRKGHINTFEYNDFGRLIRDVNAGNGGWTLQAESEGDHVTTTMTSALGRKHQFDVEQLYQGRRLTNTRPDGSVQQTLFNGNGEDIITQADGSVIRLKQGPDSRFGMQTPVIESNTVTTPAGLSSTFKMQRETEIIGANLLNLAVQTDIVTLNGKRYESRYEAATKTVTHTTPEGRISKQSINAQGRPIFSEINGLAPVSFDYDTRGRLVTLTQGEGADARITRMNYYPSGQQQGYLQSVTDALNRSVVFDYDALGRVTQQTLPDGREIQYQYDANDNPTAIQPPGRPAHIFNYNAFDLEGHYTPPSVSGINQASTVFDYNLDKELIRITRPDGQQINFSYRVGGQLATTELPRGHYAYAYSASSGQLTGITAPQGGTLAFQYDGFLPIESIWSGDIAGSVALKYNSDFLVRQRCVNETNCINYQYDKDKALIATDHLVLYRDAQRGGLITTTSLDEIATRLSYNEYGELTEYQATEERLNNETILGSLNAQANALESILIDTISEDFAPGHPLIGYVQQAMNTLRQSINQLPDSQERLIGELNGFMDFLAESAVDLGPRNNSCVGRCTLEAANCFCDSECVANDDCCEDYEPICVIGSDEFNPTAQERFNEMTLLVESVDPGGESTQAFYTSTYQRDALGRITEKTETIQDNTITESYAYDVAGRLQTVTRAGEITTYAYDSNGNRLSKQQGSTSENGIYDDQDRLQRYADCTYAYSDNGELNTKTCADKTTRYHYDVLGNLMNVTLPDNMQIEYEIDGQNRRIGKKVNGELQQGFLYQDQLNPVAELDQNNSIISRFVYADKANVPAYMIKNGTAYRVISDHLGSPRLIVNSLDGSIVQRIDYDEFGIISYDSNPGFQPFGFAGGLYDQHTTLTRFGARDYDAVVGRWASKDAMRFRGGDANLYGYVVNDPINFIDPLGLQRTAPRPSVTSNARSAAMLNGMNQAFENFNSIMNQSPTAVQQKVNEKNSVVNPNWHSMYVPVCVDATCPGDGNGQSCPTGSEAKSPPAFPPCTCKKWRIVLMHKSGL